MKRCVMPMPVGFSNVPGYLSKTRCNMNDLYAGHSDYDVLKDLLERPTKTGRASQKGDPILDPYDENSRARYKGDYVVGQKSAFEDYAFSQLYDNLDHLGAANLYRCRNARADGALGLISDEPRGLTLLEAKYTLSWSSFNSALGQFIGGEKLLRRSEKIQGATQGLIIFSDFEPGWLSDDPDPLMPWAYLYRHFVEVSDKFHLSALQITPTGFYNPFLEDNPVEGRLARLFRPYRKLAVLPRA